MEVILKDTSDHPHCPHGPCLMFQRQSSSEIKSGKCFYACSACRDRSVCGFFHWVDDKISDVVNKHWEQLIKKNQPTVTPEQCTKRLEILKKLETSHRRYCKTCNQLLLPKEQNHSGHDIIHHVTDEQLKRPTTLFQSLENKKAEAQYFFSEKTVKFITQLLRDSYLFKFLCIGAPKIHEHVYSQSAQYEKTVSMLLDIDPRYLQFFGQNQFLHYNMFNNHFFGGESSQNVLQQYLLEDGKQVVIVIDPPFGGLIDAVSHSLQALNTLWQTVNKKPVTENIPIVWFFPYFFEPRIVKSMPGLEMMDYRVEYSNHKKFGMKLTAKSTPVRMFTNIEKSSIVLPTEEGYRFCEKCKKYVSKENKHCMSCNSCTTKHGNTYKHCDSCKTCVKGSYVHCEMHGRCVPDSPQTKGSKDANCKCGPGQTKDNDPAKCYKCHGYGHKMRDCPKSGSRKIQGAKKKRRRA